ncbi:MAG: glutathione peroxidase [Candidatus Pacebacteria bacterium]|nr:glutathione peroxidase [Candidatus Paceibacterota bacterium]
MQDLYQFEMNTIDGERVKLETFRGHVLLIVNVASKCGFTKQYAGLQELYQKYGDRGLVVLGVPANDFMRQEPGSNAEIKQFCSLNYGVTFPMFAKISVKGRNQHPLYAYLTDKKRHPEYGGKITWNFNKFLISRDGRVIGRFGSRVKPLSTDLTQAVEAALSADKVDTEKEAREETDGQRLD